jgi:hypothetical protein
MFPRRPPTDEEVSIFDALVARQGKTTAPGAAGGTSIIDSGLIGAGANSFANMGVVLYPGDPLHVDARTGTVFNNITGELTLDAAYKGVAAPIPAGVPYILIPTQFVAGGIGPILASLVVPGADAIVNVLMRDVLGNKADTPLQIVAATASAIRYLKGLITALGDPTGDTLKSFETKVGNLARALSVILGARWNAAGDLSTDIAALLGAVGGTGGVIPPPGNTILDMISRPRNELYEGWQEEAGIDPGLWTVTNPATGTAWQRAAVTEDLMAFASPNANENCRLLSAQRWIVSPTTYGINKILRRFTLEFELKVTNLANFDNVNWFLGLSPTAVATRATNSIIGFALVGGGNALQTLTDLGGVETVNTGFGETLTNKNKLKIDVSLNTVDFYLNETKIASHVANLPLGPMYLNFYAPTGAGGLAQLSLGIIRAWTEDLAR